MRKSHLARTVALVPLALAMSAGAALAAGNPCDPHTYGAVGNGVIGTNNGTLNTVAIQSAINACAAAGGGIVPISNVASGGVYLTGPIQLLSHVLLQVNAGATLLATTDEGQYSIAFLDYPSPGTNVFPNTPTAPYEALIFAYQAVDTGIIGTGVINGQGNVTSTTTNRPAGTGTGGFAAGPITAGNPSYVNSVEPPTTMNCWWNSGVAPYTCTAFPTPGNGTTLNGTTWYAAPQTDMPTSNGPARPWLVEFNQCTNVTINGITLEDSPMWNLVLRNDSNVTVTNYHVQNFSDPATTVPNGGIGTNTDGLDVVGSSFVTISNINEAVGDDDVAIKSGLPVNVVSGTQLTFPATDPNEAGLETLPSHDITISNANITGGHGISIGSEASNGVYNVHIQNIKATGSTLSEGLRLKTGRTRGSYNPGIHDITIQNFVATNVVQPILIYDYYPASNPVNETGATRQCTSTITTNCIDPPQAIQPYTPNVYNITISGLTATGATSQQIISGVPEACILNVVLNNVSIQSTVSASSATGTAGGDGVFLLRHMTGTFTNVTVTDTNGSPPPAWVTQENVHVTATGTPGLTSPVNTPVLLTTPPTSPCAPAQQPS